MGEVAQRQPDDLPLPYDSDERRVLQRCWEILELALAEGRITGVALKQRLGERRVVLNGASILDIPRQVFVEDQPGLRDLFGEALSQSCIARPRAAWGALRAAGVRGLREAARAERVGEDQAAEDDEIRVRIDERREETTRILDAALEGQDRADAIAWLQSLRFASSPELRVRWRLQRVNEELVSDVHEAGAVHVRQDQLIYIRRTQGEVASWAAVAREIAAVICLTVDPSHIASQLKEVLAATTSEDAAAELDELGIPRLQHELPPASASLIAQFGGDVERPEADETGAEDGGPTVAATGEIGLEHGQDGSGIAGGVGTGPAPDGQGGETGAPGKATAGTSRKADGAGAQRGAGGGAGAKPRAQRRWIVLVSGDYGTDASEEDPEKQAARSAIDQAGIAAVLEYERRAGRFPVEMPHGNEGYDVEARDEGGELVRLIEVKSLSAPWDADAPVQLTKPQFRAAWKHEALFWLYVVENAGTANQSVVPIQNPAKVATRFAFDFGWKRRAESESLAQAIAEERELRIDKVQTLLDEIIDLGGPFPVVPYEVQEHDGRGCWLEAAWPEWKVALVSGDEAARDALLHELGWRTVRYEETLAETLFGLLKENGDSAETS
jgi:hypothetical protein